MKKLLQWLLVTGLLVICFYAYRIHRDVTNVLRYQPMVQKILDENDSQSNEELVLAMIYTETKGKSVDVMQSSESRTGAPNTITNSEESIRQGVEYLNQTISEAREKGCDMWTAIQAYNFGSGYIDFVAKRGGKNTTTLAKEYSRDVLAPKLGNKTGKSYFSMYPVAFLNGGQLYVNGGNIYYADQVAWNLGIMKVMSRL